MEAKSGATFDLAPNPVLSWREFHCLDLRDVRSMPNRPPGGGIVAGDSARLSVPPVPHKNTLASDVNRESREAVVYGFELRQKCPCIGIPNLHLAIRVCFGEHGGIA